MPEYKKLWICLNVLLNSAWICLKQKVENSPKIIVQVTWNVLIQRHIQNPVKYLIQNVFEKIIVVAGNFCKIFKIFYKVLNMSWVLNMPRVLNISCTRFWICLNMFLSDMKNTLQADYLLRVSYFTYSRGK